LKTSITFACFLATHTLVGCTVPAEGEGQGEGQGHLGESELMAVGSQNGLSAIN
jgi:hypothetical protein